MNSKNRKTLETIFTLPIKSNIRWADLEALLLAVGAETVEGRGSRVSFVKGGFVATFHRPHPGKEAKPYQVKDARIFLEALEVKP